jgi:hypothetical protein
LDNPQETRLSCVFKWGSSEAIRQVSGLFAEEGAVELSVDWVVGFVDGEGCFHVSLNRHKEMTAGYQVLPEFVVVQHQRDRQVLEALKRFFKSGVVRGNHDDRLCLRIRKLEALQRVCDLFGRHPLKTKKNVDFHKFRRILHLMSQRRHLTREGLVEIIDVAKTMNSANRPALDEIRQELARIG